MSAYKTAIIRLGESEYKRLKEAEEQLRLIALTQTDQLNNRIDQNRSIFDRMVADHETRQHNFDSMVTMVDQELSDLEKNTSQYVRNQIESLEDTLFSVESKKSDRTNQYLNSWINQVNSEIIAHQTAMDGYLNQINETIAKNESRSQAYSGEARKWIEISNNSLELIYQTYLLDSQSANYLEFQRQVLNQAIQEFNNGFVELACTAAFQVFSSISQIRIQLEAEQAMKTALYQNILSQANFLLETSINQKQVAAMDNDGNELQETIDVNFWTDGEFLIFNNSLACFVQDLKNFKNISIPELQVLKEKLFEFNETSIELVTRARIAVLSSQLRFNIAQIVVEALESQGFYVESAAYQQKDFRGSFTASTRNLSGNEVVVTVDPTSNIDEGGKLNIFSKDAAQLTEHELLQRNKEILTAVQNHGLSIGNIQSSPIPDPLNNAGSILEPILATSKPVTKEKNHYGRR